MPRARSSTFSKASFPKADRYSWAAKSGAASLLRWGPSAADSGNMLRRLKSTRAIVLAFAVASISLVGCTAGAAGAGAAPGTSITAPGVSVQLGGAGSDNSTALQFFLLLTILSLVPAILMMVTSFVRITIVLSFVRNAIGAQQMPQ